jgi:DNA-binding NarL/FixJ family response regulator
MPYSVLHIEDDPLWTVAVSETIRLWADTMYIGAETEGGRGLARCRTDTPDIVLLETRASEPGTTAIFDHIRALPKPPGVILLTGRTTEFTLFQSLRQVIGLVWKTADFRLYLRAAAESVLAGRRFLCPEFQKAAQRFRSMPDAFYKILSNRELALLRYFGEGFRDDEVATLVGLARATTRRHRQNIMAKLGLHRTADLVRWAQEKGFSNPALPAPLCDV